MVNKTLSMARSARSLYQHPERCSRVRRWVTSPVLEELSPMPIGPFRIQHHALLGSTNDEAKRLAAQGCAHGTVIWADEQTAGHGRYGRPWQSPPGNLLFSVVLRPSVPALRAAELGFLCAVVTAECVATLLPPGEIVSLKWPNDVHVDGAKVAGILPEAQSAGDTLAWVVLGIGLNLAHAPVDTPYPATRLHAHGATVTPELALRTFLALLELWLPRWESDGFAPIRTAWLSRARGLGSEVTINLGVLQKRGIFRGLDADGAMMLETKDGPQRITAGDVAFGVA
jgi:BirA family biotin operon repressor/biotin-[acetyl-CoA-carboxylase] ligase